MRCCVRSGRSRPVLNLLVWCCVLLLPSVLRAGLESRVLKDDSGEHRYSVFIPKDYSPDRKWPVLLFLHGAGERGSDGQKQLTLGLGPVLEKRKDSFPFVVVLPQCEDVKARYLAGWLAETADAKRALAMLETTEKELSIDPQKRVLTGWSMGGYGTWSIAAADPSRWSAIVPLAGGGRVEWAEKLKDTPVWAFHGGSDAAIRPQQSRRMIAALQAAGAHPRYTEIAGADHDITGLVYDNDTLIQWMLDPQSEVPAALALSAAAPVARRDEPFVPAMDLSGAVTIRLGNRALDALAMSIPQMLPPDMLSGRLADIYDSTVVEGRQFSIAFGGISYGAQLWRVRISAYRQDRLNVQIGLTNAILRIGGTTVTGREHSAVTGPIDVGIGHQYPVWLSFDVTPFVENRKLRLKLVAASFSIPDDNWYVTYPAGVSVRGFGMTREAVSSGLVRGLYGSKYRIENEVTAIIPRIVEEMEKQLSVTQADQLVNSFWPLPVYKPRIQLWPQDVSTDDKGVSVVMGVTAAAVDPARAPREPVRRQITATKAGEVDRSEDLLVRVAPKVLGDLTQLLIDADVAKIDVLDIPEDSFVRLADPVALQQVFPDLKRYGDNLDVRSELRLAGPIDIRSDADSGRMMFAVPDVSIGVSVRPLEGTANWQPFAELKLDVGQSAETSLVRVDLERRAFRLDWHGEPSVKASAEFNQAYKPEDATVHADQLADLFRSAWVEWAGQGPASETIIPDIDLGLTKMRLSEAGWKAPWLGVAFSPPGITITNSSDVPYSYETRGPYSSWGGPYTLAPGKTHEYPITYPLILRHRLNGDEEQFTLPVGSHSEFRVPRDGGKPRLFRAREDLTIRESVAPVADDAPSP